MIGACSHVCTTHLHVCTLWEIGRHHVHFTSCGKRCGCDKGVCPGQQRPTVAHLDKIGNIHRANELRAYL